MTGLVGGLGPGPPPLNPALIFCKSTESQFVVKEGV